MSVRLPIRWAFSIHSISFACSRSRRDARPVNSVKRYLIEFSGDKKQGGLGRQVLPAFLYGSVVLIILFHIQVVETLNVELIVVVAVRTVEVGIHIVIDG